VQLAPPLVMMFIRLLNLANDYGGRPRPLTSKSNVVVFVYTPYAVLSSLLIDYQENSLLVEFIIPKVNYEVK